ncbi:OmpA family protein [Phenylobacterium immobile]|uniref:OmpA family protein n=1 Tax=Phenylobacterium immobile TaxID=21 RepID=UPI000AC5D586|nr:OmpA family protein [Phenylobacterium immobile]
MQSLFKSGAILAAGLAAALFLNGCMTPRLKPAPSQAVLDARAARDAKAAACADITETPLIVATFGFQTAELSETAKLRLDEARHWLTCRTTMTARIEAIADRRGSEADQANLTRQRRSAISAYLVAGGVQPARIVEAEAAASAQPAASDVLVIRGEGQGW